MGAEDEEAKMSPPWRRFSSVIMVIVMTKGQSYEMSILLHGANSFTRSKFYPKENAQIAIILVLFANKTN